MKSVLLCFFFLLFVVANAQPATFLSQIPKYNESSSFEDSAYSKFTWQQFYALEECKEIVDPENFDFDLLNAAVFFATNKYRASKKLPLCAFSPELRNAAAIHSFMMVKNNFFNHINPFTPKLRTPIDRIQLCQFPGTRYAENVARIFINLNEPLTYTQLAENVVLDFSKSGAHDKNLRDPKLTELGTAIVFEADKKNPYRYFKVTQNFGGQ